MAQWLHKKVGMRNFFVAVFFLIAIYLPETSWATGPLLCQSIFTNSEKASKDDLFSYEQNLLQKSLGPFLHSSRFSKDFDLLTKKMMNDYSFLERNDFYQFWQHYSNEADAVIRDWDIFPRQAKNRDINPNYQAYLQIKNLLPDTWTIILDPHVLYRLPELIDLVDRRPELKKVSHATLRNELSRSLGNVKVFRALALSQSELQSILYGRSKSYLSDQDLKSLYQPIQGFDEVRININEVKKIKALRVNTSPARMLRQRLGAGSFENISSSWTLHPPLAAQVASNYAKDRKDIYIFEAELPRLELIGLSESSLLRPFSEQRIRGLMGIRVDDYVLSMGQAEIFTFAPMRTETIIKVYKAEKAPESNFVGVGGSAELAHQIQSGEIKYIDESNPIIPSYFIEVKF